MITGHPLENVINGPAHHTLHHLHFTVNYGQYFTWADRVGGSYRHPDPSLDPAHEIPSTKEVVANASVKKSQWWVWALSIFSHSGYYKRTNRCWETDKRRKVTSTRLKKWMTGVNIYISLLYCYLSAMVNAFVGCAKRPILSSNDQSHRPAYDHGGKVVHDFEVHDFKTWIFLYPMVSLTTCSCHFWFFTPKSYYIFS